MRTPNRCFENNSVFLAWPLRIFSLFIVSFLLLFEYSTHCERSVRVRTWKSFLLVLGFWVCNVFSFVLPWSFFVMQSDCIAIRPTTEILISFRCIFGRSDQWKRKWFARIRMIQFVAGDRLQEVYHLYCGVLQVIPRETNASMAKNYLTNFKRFTVAKHKQNIPE